MPGLNKPKPPNAFYWFARYIADQRKNNGRPFRSVTAALHDAALQWHKLAAEDKLDWKEKARSERQRFRSDPELRTMTQKEFIGQACEVSTNGMVSNPSFWSRHWTQLERERYADELDLLEKFDTRKRSEDRTSLERTWSWRFTENRDDLLTEPLLFISVQSSSPVEADSYVPETLAIASFTAKEGILPYSEFSCALAPENEWSTVTRRTGATSAENYVGDEDGCQARIGWQAVAKLVFQRAKKDTTAAHGPLFFCLAEEFEAVYDALSHMMVRAAAKTQLDNRRLSVTQVATLEDLTYCLFQWQNIDFPANFGQLQKQFYFDMLLERSDPCMVARLRCGAHESDSITRCPLSVVRLASAKIKQWLDNRGIPDEDIPLIERQAVTRYDWPDFSDHDVPDPADSISEDDGNGGGANPATSNNNAIVEPARSEPYFRGASTYDMTLAWVNSQCIPPPERNIPATDVSNGHEHNQASAPDTQEVQQNSVSNIAQSAYDDRGQGDNQVIYGEMSGQHGEGFEPMAGGQVGNHEQNHSIPAQESPPMHNGYANSGMNRLRNIIRNRDGSRLVGVGTELEVQHLLPHGSRGLGRGMHLVPAYVNQFQVLANLIDM